MIERVAVVGAGLMGSGISEVCARGGADVLVIDTALPALERSRERIETSLQRGVEAGKFPAAEREAALARIQFTTDVDATSDRQLVFEAIVEKLEPKLELLARLDAATPPEAILATNTSSLPIAPLASATDRPEQVVGLHFFNPVPQLPLVELISTLTTSPASVSLAEDFVTKTMGKKVIRSPDRSGFVVNAILVPFLLSAVRMYESGFASAEDIDTGLVLGAGHPMGPLRLLDMIGLDTAVQVADVLFEEFKDASCVVPPVLRRMVDAGFHGRKSGRGFYEY